MSQVLCLNCGKALMFLNEYNVNFVCFCNRKCADEWRGRKVVFKYGAKGKKRTT